MVEAENITRKVIDVLEDTAIPYMLVGSFSTNMYGIPRSTKDADFVVDVVNRGVIPQLRRSLDHLLEFDPQTSFEGLTGSTRHEATARDYPFRVEFFERANDPFALSRFERRIHVYSSVFGRKVWIPTAEDVVIQKLRWARSKDLDDARAVLSVQGTAINRSFVKEWCERLNIADRFEQLIATVPNI